MTENRGKFKIKSILSTGVTALCAIVFVFIAVLLFTPNKLSVRISARGVESGQNLPATVRAVSSANTSQVLSTFAVKANIKDGLISSDFNLPNELHNKSFVIEICLPQKGSKQENCYKDTKDNNIAYSCPYYVSEQKTRKFATLRQLNKVEDDSLLLCSNSRGGVASVFGKNSNLGTLNQLTSMPGLSFGTDGIIVSENGKLVAKSLSDIAVKDSAPTSPTKANEQTQTVEASPQTLTLSGNTLSILNGNSIQLPASTPAQQTAPSQIANQSTTGLLSMSDWNAFSAKENSLAFENGLTRVGNTISFMNCAVGQIAKSNGTGWVCANDATGSGGSNYTAGSGIAISGAGEVTNTGLLGVTTSGALTSSTSAGQAAISITTSSALTQSGGILDLANTSVTPGTYNSVTVDTKGRVTSGANISYLTAEQDGIIGNEVSDVVAGGGLVMTGAGTSASPYKVGLTTACANGNVLKYYATDIDGAGPLTAGWNCDTDTNTDGQTLTWDNSTNKLSISGGNIIDLSSLKDNTDSQGITLTGNTLAISGNATTVDLAKYLDNTDSQTLTVSGSGDTRTVSISGGNIINLPDLNTTYSAGNGLSLSGTTFALAQQGATSGQVLKWDGASWVPSSDNTGITYTAGSGITITGNSIASVLGTSIGTSELEAGAVTNTTIASGAITSDKLSSTGVTAGTYGSGTAVPVVTVDASGRITALSTTAIPTANTTTTGLLTSGDWNTFNGKENVLAFNGPLVRTGNTVGFMSCAANQLMQRNATGDSWICANQITDTNTTYSAGTGIAISGSNVISNTGLLGVTSSGALTTTTNSQQAAISLTTSSDFVQTGGTLSLGASGVNAGTYNSVTVDSKGRVTSGTNVTYLTTEQDGIVGNEVSGVIANSGLIMTGSGTALSPYKVGLVSTCSDNQLLKYTSAGGWACANDNNTPTVDTDSQTLTFNSTDNKLTISGGNIVDLSSLKDNTDSQTLTVTGSGATRTLAISGGNTVTISDTDAQQLAYDSATRVVSLTNGGSITLPADQNTTYSNGNGVSLTGTVFAINSPTCTGTDKLIWTGTAFQCSSDVDTNTLYSGGNGITLSGTSFAISAPTCSADNYLTWNGTSFSCVTDKNTTYTAGTGVSVTGTTIANTGVLTVATGTGITNTGTTQNPVLKLTDTTVTPGSYGTSNQISTFTVDQQGRLTAAGQVAVGNLNTSAISSGVLSAARGGTGVDGSTAANGSLLIGNGTGYSLAGITGTNNQIIVTNGAGSIKISTPQDIATTSSVTFANTTTSNALSVGGTANLNGNTVIGDSTADTVTINGILQGATPLRFDGATKDNNVLTVQVLDPTTSSTATIPLLPTSDTFVFQNLQQTLTNKTLTDVVLNGGVSGSAISTNPGLINTTTGLPSDTVIASQRAVKSYVDSLVLGLNWKSPTIGVNVIADLTAPPANPVVGDAYVIKTGGNTGAWSSFSAGNIVYWGSDNQWHLGSTPAVGSRFGISMHSATPGAGSFASKDNQIVTITGGTPGNWTYSFTTPTDNDAFYVDNPLSLYNGETLVYSDKLTQWVQMSASSSLTYTNGIERSGNVVQTKLLQSGGLQIKDNSIALTNCPVGQTLKSTGVNTYGCADDNNTTYAAGSGLTLSGTEFSVNSPTCAANQFLTWNGTAFQCAATNATPDTTNLNIAANAGTPTNIQAGDTINFQNGNGTTVQVTGKNITYGLTSVGTAGTYGSSTSIPVITTDAYGRITSATSQAIPTASATTTGLLSATDFASFLNKQDALTFTGRNLFTKTGNTVAATTCADGELMKYETASGNWKCSTDANTLYTAGSGISVTGTSIANTGVLSVSSSSTPIAIGGTAQNPTIGFQNGTTAGQYWNWSGTAWQLANAPVDTNTTYSAGQGLELAGTTFKLTQQGATTGQILAWNGSGWTPTTDANTTYSASTNGGLTLTGTQFGLKACTAGQILKASATSGDWACAADTDTTYTAGSGITITGTTIANTLGTSIESSEITDGTITASDLATTGATAGTYANSGVNVAQLTVNAQGQVTAISNRALPTASSTTTGVLSNTDWSAFNAKENALTISDGLTRTGNTVSLMDCAANQILQRNSTDTGWACAAQVSDTNTTYTAGNGLTLTGTSFAVNAPTCTAGQYTTWNGSAFSCSTPTDTTNFNISANGIGSQAIASGNTVNFQNGTGTTATVDGSKNVSFGLTNTGVTAGTYTPSANGTGGLTVPNFAVDAQGRLTSAGTTTVTPTGIANAQLANSSITVNANGPLSTTTSTIALGGSTTLSLNLATSATATTATTASASGLEVASGTLSLVRGCATGQVLKWDATNKQWGCANDADANSGGTVTSITAGTGLTGGTITSSGTIALGNSGVTSGTYGSGTTVPVLQVDQYGRITSASTTAIPTANSTTTGLLTNTDWNTFNGKENVLSFNGPLSRTGNTVSLAACATNQTYVYDGTSWVCTNQSTGNTYTAATGGGLTLATNAFSIDCTTASAKAFCNGGNSYGAAATLGTNDAFGLNFETGGAVAATLSATGEMLFKDPTNSTVSFAVQNSTSVPMFTVDTTNRRITVGSATSDATAVTLILDGYNVATDPTGVNGSMYYNSNLGKFRCFEANAWKDCISGASTYPQILVEASKSTTQTLTSTDTGVFFNSVSTNAGTAYNAANGTFTAPATGIYRIDAMTTAVMSSLDTSSTEFFYTKLFKGTGVIQNATNGASHFAAWTSGGYNVSNQISRTVSMNTGETLSIKAGVSVDNGQYLDVADPAKNILQIVRLK